MRVMPPALRRRSILSACVKTGAEAVQAKRVDGLPYEVIFVDMVLKDMTGAEAAKLIRVESATNRTAPIILFSHNQDDQETFFHGQGGNLYVLGDLLQADLDTTLDRWCPVRRYEKSTDKPPVPTGPPPSDRH